MRTTRRLPIIAVVLALPLALASWAAAAPGAAPAKKPVPTTSVPPVEHPPGMSCAEAAVYYGLEDALMTWSPQDGEVLPVTLDADTPSVCIDLFNEAPGTFTLAVTNPGSAGVLSASIRDSHPGDFCTAGTPGISLKKGETKLDLGEIPAATLNACGTEYSEADIDDDGNLVSQTWDQDAAVEDPLAFMIFYGRSGPTTVGLTVTFHASS